MSNGAEDRLALLLAQSQRTGIDFIFVHESQDRLDVFFLLGPETLDVPLPGTLTASDLRIENIRDANTPDVIVTGVSWPVVDGRTVMRLNVVRPASFAMHWLTIVDPQDPSRIDPYYRSRDFSFQANCESGLDCEEDEAPSFPETYVDFPVDYSARDFLSFRRALLDFASQRYPRWVDRLEADVGVMLVEVMSAFADEMAYGQDRISREAYLATATQRFSLRQHARLVDYEPFDGLAPSTVLDVTASAADTVPVGTRVTDADGVHTFEVGVGLFDESGGYPVDPARNRFLPYFWDEDDLWLPEGSTELYVAGAVAAAFPPLSAGWPILLQTNPADASDPAVRVFVRLLEAENDVDGLTGDAITRLRWDVPTPYPIDKTGLELRGNLIPATGGLTLPFEFTVGASSDPDAPAVHAISRRGADGVPLIRVSLPGTDEFGIATLINPESGAPRAEIRLYRASKVGGAWVANDEWLWQASLLGTASSRPFDPHFTLDDGTWGRVVGYPVPGGEFVHEDYRSDAGLTIRFGDGEFGMNPPSGTVFVAQYRLNTGENLPRHVLNRIDPATPLNFVDAITNPEAVTDAQAPESAESVRANAPEAFRAIAYRAVKPDDYAEAAERLDWVQNAGATMRWTGSWRTIFVSADPSGAVALTEDQRRALNEQIERFRQAGQDVQQRPPLFADLDFEITVCAEFSSYAGAVEEAVLAALTGPTGFFSPDNFTFGTILYRGALDAAIGSVPGVRAVESIRFRRRGWFDWREFGTVDAFYDPGVDAIVRVQNDRVYPEHGIVDVIVTGGA